MQNVFAAVTDDGHRRLEQDVLPMQKVMIAIAAAAGIGWSATANAAKADKRDFFYQDRPKDGKSCATCRLFSAAPSGQGNCAIVDGEVSPNGWCMAYSPKV